MRKNASHLAFVGLRIPTAAEEGLARMAESRPVMMMTMMMGDGRVGVWVREKKINKDYLLSQELRLHAQSGRKIMKTGSDSKNEPKKIFTSHHHLTEVEAETGRAFDSFNHLIS